MATQLLTKTIDDQTRAEASEVTQEVRDRRIVGTRFVLDDGAEVDLSEQLSGLVASVIDGLTRGGLRIQSLPNELTTTTAAEVLGISRPTLMKLVAAGKLPSHRVGSHHRFTLSDVLTLKEERRSRRASALRDLRAFDLERGVED